MSLIRREKRALPFNIDPDQVTARPYFPNYSGEVVTEITAFASSAVTSAVMLLADCTAVMPLDLTRRTGGRIEVLDTPTLLVRPNDDQLMFEFVHQLVTSLAVHGVAYLYAPRRANQLPPEMRVLPAKQVVPYYDKKDGQRKWKLGTDVYTNSEIRQIDWLKMAGQLRGLSPLEVLRNSVGVSLAMDRFLSQFYGEGAVPSSVLESDKPITKEQAQVLRDTWMDTHLRRRLPAVLSNGLRWRPIVTSAADAQMLEHREAVIRDIARAYRIPPHMINSTNQGSSLTYQNIESAGINFVRYTLLPWMRRIEDAISDTLPVDQRVRFNADEFMRGDLTTRVRAQQIQIMTGTLTPNEARQIEGREAYAGGDEFVMALAGAPMAGGAELEPLGVDDVVLDAVPEVEA